MDLVRLIDSEVYDLVEYQGPYRSNSESLRVCHSNLVITRVQYSTKKQGLTAAGNLSNLSLTYPYLFFLHATS